MKFLGSFDKRKKIRSPPEKCEKVLILKCVLDKNTATFNAKNNFCGNLFSTSYTNKVCEVLLNQANSSKVS